jgi:hypothetical protein
VRIGGRAEHGADVTQVLALDAASDRLDHLPLNVLGVDDAVRADSAREVHREPAACCADLRDDGALGDEERVHDLIRLLPLLAIGRFEESQIERVEQIPRRPRLFRRNRGGLPPCLRRRIGGAWRQESSSEEVHAESERRCMTPAHGICLPHPILFAHATGVSLTRLTCLSRQRSPRASSRPPRGSRRGALRRGARARARCRGSPGRW